MLEKAFRTAAQYAYVFNQSRAKVVLDPIYATVAGRLMRNEIPLSPRLAAARFDDDLYPEYRAQARRLQYFIEDWDFSEARPELLTPRQRKMIHTVALGESSGAAVSDGFLRAFRTSPELSQYFGTWFVEELNHYRGNHLYLQRMGEGWAPEKTARVAGVEFRPYSEDALEVCACNMYQELAAYLIYRSFGRQAKDPFLGKMMTQFAKDELRHYKFYQNVVARQIQREPAFRKVVLKVFLKAVTPYNQVSEGPGAVLEHLQSGIFYFRQREYEFFLEQVEYLLGDRFESLFGFYFRDNLEPCERCKEQLFRCGCEVFE